jgi:hypothetical protein
VQVMITGCKIESSELSPRAMPAENLGQSSTYLTVDHFSVPHAPPHDGQTLRTAFLIQFCTLDASGNLCVTAFRPALRRPRIFFLPAMINWRRHRC